MSLDITGLILGILGLFGWPLIWRFLGSDLVRIAYSRFGSAKRVRREVRNLVLARTIPSSQEEAGTFKSVRVRYFVDLLSASCNPEDRGVLDRWLTRWIWLRGLKPNRIASPKLGNMVLGSTVARRLDLPLVAVYPEQSLLHTRAFDGEVRPGEVVLIVDDVASDSRYLLQVVDRLRRANAVVLGVVALVNRTEGDCEASLAAAQVPFYPVLNLGDAELRGNDSLAFGEGEGGVTLDLYPSLPASDAASGRRDPADRTHGADRP